MKVDYQKMYEDALEKAKTIHSLLKCSDDSKNYSYAETIEDIFPELRESDDEKIRKEIIDFVKRIDFTKEKSEKWISWLEKQGENAPYSGTSFDYNGHTYGMCAREGGVDILCDSQLIRHIEKQGEQKPIEQDTETRDLWVYIREWNDKFGRLPKDDDELAACIDYVMKRQKPTDNYCQENCKGYRDTGGKCFADGECEAKKKVEQKSAWSEEDEDAVDIAIRIIQNGGDDCAGILDSNKALKWLKSLKDRVQPQLKQEY